tara:strand:+ start:914 stop:1378 length:465 start_codon:yes stop_codon:yes gene_type:complete
MAVSTYTWLEVETMAISGYNIFSAVKPMSEFRTVAPYIALHYLILGLGIGFVRYVIYADALVLIAIIAAPAITAFVFVKRTNRLLVKREALTLIVFGGTPILFMFATITAPELNEPYTGWLLRLITLIFGALLGYGVCSIYYLSEKIWSKYVKA